MQYKHLRYTQLTVGIRSVVFLGCHVVQRHNLHLHLHADDCQVYTSVAVEDATLAELDCLHH